SLCERLPIHPLLPYTTLFRSKTASRHQKQPPPSVAMARVESAAAWLGVGFFIECAPVSVLSFKREFHYPAFSFIVDRREFVCPIDRKSTRLNSSHVKISYAVF